MCDAESAPTTSEQPHYHKSLLLNKKKCIQHKIHNLTQLLHHYDSVINNINDKILEIEMEQAHNRVDPLISGIYCNIHKQTIPPIRQSQFLNKEFKCNCKEN